MNPTRRETAIVVAGKCASPEEWVDSRASTMASTPLGYTSSELIQLRWCEETHSGMMIPNPAPKSNPEPRAASLDIDDPKACQQDRMFQHV